MFLHSLQNILFIKNISLKPFYKNALWQQKNIVFFHFSTIILKQARSTRHLKKNLYSSREWQWTYSEIRKTVRSMRYPCYTCHESNKNLDHTSFNQWHIEYISLCNVSLLLTMMNPFHTSRLNFITLKVTWINWIFTIILPPPTPPAPAVLLTKTSGNDISFFFRCFEISVVNKQRSILTVWIKGFLFLLRWF